MFLKSDFTTLELSIILKFPLNKIDFDCRATNDIDIKLRQKKDGNTDG